MKYTKKTSINRTTPLVKCIPSLVAGVVIASLSASVTANQLNSKLQTPAQVEQALTALLDSREATLQLASHPSKQSSSPVGSSVFGQASTKKVDHSQKSVAELVLAGLAITSEAKDELASSASTIEPAIAVAQDYAVADIVSVDELDAANNENASGSIQDSEFDSNETENASIANVDYSIEAEAEANVDAEIEIQPVAQEVANNFAAANSQVSSNIKELDEDALPAMPVSEALVALIAEEQSEVEDSSTLLEGNDQPESVEAFAMNNTDEMGIVETETTDIVAVEIEVTETATVEMEVTETATVEMEVTETATVEMEAIEEDVAEFAVTETVEAEAAEVAVVETEVVETEVAEIAVVETEAVETEVAEIAVVETKAVETEVAEIAVVETETVEIEVAEIAVVETETVETEVAEIAVVETKAVETGVNEAKFVQSNIVEAELAEEVAPTNVDLEESAPMQLATDVVTNKVDANVTVVTRSAGCPEDFNKISIPVNGKMCQIFAADFPASMILFIPQTPEEVIQYYLASSANFVEPKTIKQRTMLKSTDNNTTLIISKDGGGTQVDILVKSPVI